METPLRQNHEALAATWIEIAGTALPRHYGDAVREYEAVREGVGVVDRSDLALIRLWGRDPVKMVQGLITNDLAGAPADRGVYGVMLTPKGRVVAELRAQRQERAGEPGVLLDLPREALEAAREHLKKYVPPMFARWGVEEDMGVVGAYGPRSRELVGRALGTELPELPEDAIMDAVFGSETVRVAGSRYTGEEGYDLFAARTALPALWDALLAQGRELDARPAGQAALEMLRIEAGRPRAGRELTEETIPTEAFESTGLMPRAVSFTKGCYTGQEVIVRIAHRGHVNRHLRGLLLGESPLPGTRTPLFHPEMGKEVGWTTSASHSPRLSQSVALAYVRREIPPGGKVRLGSGDGAEVTVTELPFPFPA